MKLINPNKPHLVIILSIFIGLPLISWSQPKRLKPPKRSSRIESVDNFVSHSFELYHKVFVYDSLTKAGIEIPAEIEDELIERAEIDADSLWQEVPDLLEEISDASVMKQAKATINLNKTKKALKFCLTAIKNYFTEPEED
ncbi:hypothetical protein [Winogradskyella endarachnes]|uniref:Uncharacterized protein n=1 Tax=Winogradskyella endarachnes TaxID=2681965 RepID=A0A6L6UBL4_9FLAO|nr:hypothetical protein [Winogradskyella endarachnes]MUU78297.1 hypothetical protein [Winogradskyella endarachnes]